MTSVTKNMEATMRSMNLEKVGSDREPRGEAGGPIVSVCVSGLNIFSATPPSSYSPLFQASLTLNRL